MPVRSPSPCLAVLPVIRGLWLSATVVYTQSKIKSIGHLYLYFRDICHVAITCILSTFCYNRDINNQQRRNEMNEPKEKRVLEFIDTSFEMVIGDSCVVISDESSRIVLMDEEFEKMFGFYSKNKEK